MDIEILFTALSKDQWSEFSSTGKYIPTDFEETGSIVCADSKNLNTYLNEIYGEQEQIMLLVLDPLRIQVPMKRTGIGNFKAIELKQPFSLDAIIDKLNVPKGESGTFEVEVRHFD